eukprot:971628-Amphidinium_carterae.1
MEAAHLEESMPGRLTSEDRDSCLSDFHSARPHMMSVLTLQLACWEALPLKLAGVAHRVPAEGRLVAASCLSGFGVRERLRMRRNCGSWLRTGA